MAGFQRHVFVCVNERPPGNPKGCCKSKGSEAVRDELKKQLAALGLKGAVRANNAGCLDQCETGVTVVVYPEQVWYGKVTVADVFCGSKRRSAPGRPCALESLLKLSNLVR